MEEFNSEQLVPYIGLPYEIGGRDHRGVDCYGLVELIYKEIHGIQLPSYVEYYSQSMRTADFSRVIDSALLEGKWKKVESPAPFDVITFRLMGRTTHVGMALENGDFLHSFNGTQSCIENMYSISWRNRINGIYRWTH